MIYVKLLTSEFQGPIPSFFRIPELKSSLVRGFLEKRSESIIAMSVSEEAIQKGLLWKRSIINLDRHAPFSYPFGA